MIQLLLLCWKKTFERTGTTNGRFICIGNRAPRESRIFFLAPWKVNFCAVCTDQRSGVNIKGQGEEEWHGKNLQQRNFANYVFGNALVALDYLLRERIWTTIQHRLGGVGSQRKKEASRWDGLGANSKPLCSRTCHCRLRISNRTENSWSCG